MCGWDAECGMGMERSFSKDSVEAFKERIALGEEPPEGGDPALRALWLVKLDRWDEAHEIASGMGGKTGDWIHALLHVIEGDLGNAAYWYERCGEPAIEPEGIDAEWERIAAAVV